MWAHRATVLVSVGTLAAALLTGGTAQAKGVKVDVCHGEGDGAYHSITVSENALPAHRAHGDGLPGEAVPGMDGFVFGDDCVPVEVATEVVYAVAYTDMVDDGNGYDPGVDVLIGKVVEASGDDVLGDGDVLVLGSYPTAFDMSSSGDFQVGDRAISNPFYGAGLNRLTFDIGATRYEFVDNTGRQRFQELPGQTFIFRDGLTVRSRIDVKASSPSQPTVAVPSVGNRDLGDDPFLDVEIYPAGREF